MGKKEAGILKAAKERESTQNVHAKHRGDVQQECERTEAP